SVTVSASPAACYSFLNWTENGAVVSTSASYTFTAGANRSLVANFAPITYTITSSSSPVGSGSLTGGGVMNCGSSVMMTAAAAANYSFANWTENGNVVGSSTIYTFTAGANRNLVANFTSTLCPLTVALTSPTSGSTVSNTVTLAASANACATRVDFYCDNQT